ncbi:hypothetical protein QCA50_003042 [Cerrena zonata]|uniref:Family A G protein-coupled receptor-like protein n=1 Tax=Cerrena zonata TaxID=2478898 RepID=A0AAW0GVD9_9APHY
MGGNQALDVNPPNANINLSKHGSDWLWALFAVFGLSLLITVFFDRKRARGTRLFHQIAVVVLATMSISYFSMASDLGSTPVAVEFRDIGSTRQIWFVRYIQWFITFPLLLLQLLLLTGFVASDILTVMFMGIVFVVSGLVGSLVPSSYKWGYYTFGLLALFYIWYALLFRAPRTTFAADGFLRGGYMRLAGWLSFVLALYPICWAVSEGANVIRPTSEMIFYGILDLLAGPVFLFALLWHLKDVDYNTFGFAQWKYTDPTYVNGAVAPRTVVAPVTTVPVTTTYPIAQDTTRIV